MTDRSTRQVEPETTSDAIAGIARDLRHSLKRHFRLRQRFCQACGQCLGVIEDMCPSCGTRPPAEISLFCGVLLTLFSVQTLVYYLT